MWDNLFRIILLNLGFILVMGLAVTLPWLINLEPFIPDAVKILVAVLLGLSAVCVYSGAAACITKDIADYQEPGFKDFWTYLKQTYKPSLLFGIINSVIIFLLSMAMPFYLGMKSLLGPLAFAFLFWIGLIWVVSCQFFFPLQARFDKSFKKNLKNIFLVFFDNTFFALGVFIGTIFVFVISSFTAFMLPGIGTVLLWISAGLKLRLYKYDYLETHPEANRKRIPWDALLIEDKDRVGKRTLRGMIFPWKE